MNEVLGTVGNEAGKCVVTAKVKPTKDYCARNAADKNKKFKYMMFGANYTPKVGEVPGFMKDKSFVDMKNYLQNDIQNIACVDSDYDKECYRRDAEGNEIGEKGRCAVITIVEDSFSVYKPIPNSPRDPITGVPLSALT